MLVELIMVFVSVTTWEQICEYHSDGFGSVQELISAFDEPKNEVLNLKQQNV